MLLLFLAMAAAFCCSCCYHTALSRERERVSPILLHSGSLLLFFQSRAVLFRVFASFSISGALFRWRTANLTDSHRYLALKRLVSFVLLRASQAPRTIQGSCTSTGQSPRYCSCTSYSQSLYSLPGRSTCVMEGDGVNRTNRRRRGIVISPPIRRRILLHSFIFRPLRHRSHSVGGST